MQRPTGILLDIEGTTSSISFVHDVMFPYVLQRLDNYLEQHFDDEDLQPVFEQIAQDAGHGSLASWQREQAGASARELVAAEVRRLMSDDVKATGLKALQGFMWKDGFESGELRAHVYPDVIPSIKAWKDQGIDVRIYSSGSIAAQRLFFSHLEEHGDQLRLFSGHYDTTIGGKKESASYARIAEQWGMQLDRILFISDIADELLAAQQAGLPVLASLRPGNAQLPDDFSIPGISSFAEIEFDS